MKEIEEFYNRLLKIKYGWHDKEGRLHPKIEPQIFAKEYKKQMESEAKEISHKIDEMVEEHNRLLEIIKRLREIAQQLELGNLAKARDIVSHHQKSR